MTFLNRFLNASRRLSFHNKEGKIKWLSPFSFLYQFFFPHVWVDSEKLYSDDQIRELDNLLNELDYGEVGGYGFDEKAKLQLRKTPFVHCEFEFESEKIKSFSIVKIDEYERTVPERLEKFLSGMVEVTIQRMLKVRPQLHPYFKDVKRVCSITFVRYEIRSQKSYPEFPWHSDLAYLQSITPVHIPKSLEGAHLQFLDRTLQDESKYFALDIKSEENKPVFFENQKYWHRVTPFKLTNSPAEVELRDVFTVEIYDDLAKPNTNNWRR